MEINELTEKVVELTKQIQFGRNQITEIVDRSRKEGRESTPEERKEIDDIIAKVETWSEELRQAKRLLDLEGKLSEAQRDAIKPQFETTADGEIPGMPPKKMRFKDLGEQLMAIRRASPANPEYKVDSRLQTRATGANESAPTDGGFLVQADYAAEIVKRAYSVSPVVSRVRRMPLSGKSNSIKINAIAESSRASSVWGGIVMYWLGEGATKTASRPEFRQMELTLKKIAGLFYATDELLEDASALASLANDGFSEALNLELERVVLRGTGAGQPLGILNSPALITVSAEGYQWAGSIVWENIVKMYARLWAGSLPNAIWTVSQSCVPELLQMTTSTSPTANPGSPVWLRDNNLAGAPYGTILGIPVFPIENASAVGTVGDIMLLDLSQYLMIDKGGVQQASSIHVNFLYDESVFRWVYRCDGQPAWNTTLTPKNSGDTQSPFVALESRT